MINDIVRQLNVPRSAFIRTLLYHIICFVFYMYQYDVLNHISVTRYLLNAVWPKIIHTRLIISLRKEPSSSLLESVKCFISDYHFRQIIWIHAHNMNSSSTVCGKCTKCQHHFLTKKSILVYSFQFHEQWQKLQKCGSCLLYKEQTSIQTVILYGWVPFTLTW